jgi:hypothetical protein
MSFWTTPSGAIMPQERMVIRANGNVGIGTSNPTGLFHVATSPSSSGPGKSIELEAQTGASNSGGGDIMLKACLAGAGTGQPGHIRLQGKTVLSTETGSYAVNGAGDCTGGTDNCLSFNQASVVRITLNLGASTSIKCLSKVGAVDGQLLYLMVDNQASAYIVSFMGQGTCGSNHAPIVGGPASITGPDKKGIHFVYDGVNSLWYMM